LVSSHFMGFLDEEMVPAASALISGTVCVSMMNFLLIDRKRQVGWTNGKKGCFCE
jgi:hypothetical protein